MVGEATTDDGSYIKQYTDGQPVKTVKYQDGWLPLVRFINGEIVRVGHYGKLAVLSDKLEVLKEYYKYNGTNYVIRSLVGNDKFIAYGDNHGVVVYYNRGGASESQKVSKNFIL